MADTLDTITKLIQSPPGQLAAGGVLAGIVWKFFERVEAVLTENTKLEIARWLRVRNIETGLIADNALTWPETLAKVFDRVFGTKHLSWKCFWRSCAFSFGFAWLVQGIWYANHPNDLKGICCLLAGSVAQSMFMRVEWSIERMLIGGDGYYGSADDDLNRATDSARQLLGNRHEPGTEAYRLEAVHIENDVLPVFAEKVGVHLKGGWDLVRVVAEALNERERLTRNQFSRLVRLGCL
jgi:hypothetical protein